MLISSTNLPAVLYDEIPVLRIAVIAGEPSGDMLAARLIHELKNLSAEPIEFIGIGGERMANEGFNSLHNMDILTVMGFGLDLLKAVPKILAIRQKVIKQILKAKVDVFIGVDAPDFNFYVEKKLRNHGVKTVHYVSPTIWAWRYNRIFKIKKSTDLMLCIFPMEEPMYRKEHVKAKFIGHHLADQIELNVDTDSYKAKLGLTGTIFTILPGSRKSEINSLGKILIQTCSQINKQISGATFLFPLVSQTTHDLFLKLLNEANIDFKYQVLIKQTSNAIKASDMVLAKSGTVTLEVALCQKPLILCYKVSKFAERTLRKKIYIKFVGLPNILLNEEVAKEMLQEDANPDSMAKCFVELYHDKARQQQVIEKFHDLHISLRQNASYEGAKAVLELINSKYNHHHSGLSHK